MAINRPRSLKDEEEIKQRQTLLHLPHIKPLTEYVEKLNSQKHLGTIPWFDPLDGGTKAKVLFLFEKPGPKTYRQKGGSGFISRNNNDTTAENTFKIMQQINLPRTETCMWNTIPGWNEKIPFTSAELKTGFSCLPELLLLLPRLKAIVLVGIPAQKIEKAVTLPAHLKIIKSYHPSPRNRINWPAIPPAWAKVHDYI